MNWNKVSFELVGRWIDVLICLFLMYGMTLLWLIGYVSFEAAIMSLVWSSIMAGAITRNA